MSTVAADETHATSRVSRPRLLAWALAGLALIAIGIGAHWWTHATVFHDLGDSIAMDPLPVAKGALSSTVIFPDHDARETITIKSIDANFSTNTAGARATFSICHMGAGDAVIGTAHTARRWCHDIVPAGTGSTVRLGTSRNRDYVFVTITPTRPGSAHLESFDIDYRRSGSHLFQRGSQTIQADRRLTVY
ncbi:MAG: hypothetical protein ACXVEQ_19960 [Nocardioidaceae bacterium]